jgi:hypothetical protein
MVAPFRTCDVTKIGRSSGYRIALRTQPYLEASHPLVFQLAIAPRHVRFAKLEDLFTPRKMVRPHPRPNPDGGNRCLRPAPFGTGSVAIDIYATASRTPDGILIVLITVYIL